MLRSDLMPVVERPPWLTYDALAGALPLPALLNRSVFYPAAGLDPDPIRHLGRYFWSFIYADYGVGRDAVASALQGAAFAGCRVIGVRSIDEQEIPVGLWRLNTHGYTLAGCRFDIMRQWAKPAFAEWVLLERCDEPNGPGAPISLLFLGAEGVTTLQNLYVANEAAPECVAVIQPGHAFGGNWTCFPDPELILAEALERNPAGRPQYLLYGGNGRPWDYAEKPCWPQYSTKVGWLLDRSQNLGGGGLALWGRPVPQIRGVPSSIRQQTTQAVVRPADTGEEDLRACSGCGARRSVWGDSRRRVCAKCGYAYEE